MSLEAPDLRGRAASAVPICVGLLLLACGDAPPELPDVEPFTDLRAVVAFEQRASDILETRPVAVGQEGDVMELRGTDEWLYLFDEHTDSLPPDPGARLSGLQMRKEYWDTTVLWRDWTERYARYQDFSRTEPVCSRVTRGRLTTTRADFPGPVRLSVGVQILMGEDGQSFESWLISGTEVAQADSIVEDEAAHDRLDCSEALPEGPGA